MTNKILTTILAGAMALGVARGVKAEDSQKNQPAKNEISQPVDFYMDANIGWRNMYDSTNTDNVIENQSINATTAGGKIKLKPGKSVKMPKGLESLGNLFFEVTGDYSDGHGSSNIEGNSIGVVDQEYAGKIGFEAEDAKTGLKGYGKFVISARFNNSHGNDRGTEYSSLESISSNGFEIGIDFKDGLFTGSLSDKFAKGSQKISVPQNQYSCDLPVQYTELNLTAGTNIGKIFKQKNKLLQNLLNTDVSYEFNSRRSDNLGEYNNTISVCNKGLSLDENVSFPIKVSYTSTSKDLPAGANSLGSYTINVPVEIKICSPKLAIGEKK